MPIKRDCIRQQNDTAPQDSITAGQSMKLYTGLSYERIIAEKPALFQ